MSEVRSEKIPFKFDIDPALKEAAERVFEAQGTTIQEGMGRLVRFLVELPPDLWPLILGQAPGNAARAVAKEYLGVGHVPRTAKPDTAPRR